MYYTSGVDKGIRLGSRNQEGIKLGCGRHKRAEKNWIPFETESGVLHFVYSIYPHKVVFLEPKGGECKEDSSLFSSFAPIGAVRAKHPEWEFRGSAQALHIWDTEATPNLKVPHYLALFHVFDTETHQYAHFAYRFSPKAPFQILQVSAELDLQTAQAEEGTGVHFAYVSSLAVKNRQVIIAYTAGDRDSRALVLSLRKLDSLFGPTGNSSGHENQETRLLAVASAAFALRGHNSKQQERLSYT
jgi:hypothetical protein